MRQWLIAKVLGPFKFNGKETIITPTKGVLENSIIRPLICNLTLNGIQELLEKYKKRNLSFFEPYNLQLTSILKKHNYNSNFNIKTKLYFIRYASNLLVYGTPNNKHFINIKKLLIDFLSYKGLNIKGSFEKSFIFKPGKSFEFLGYKFFFPGSCNKKTINNGRYTKIKHTPFNIANNLFSIAKRCKIIVKISPTSYRNISKKIKNCFHSKNNNKNVYQIINNINKIILNSVKYFGYTEYTKIQFERLDFSIRRWF